MAGKSTGVDTIVLRRKYSLIRLLVNMKQQAAAVHGELAPASGFTVYHRAADSADSVCEIGEAAWHPEQKSQASFCEVRHGFAGGALVGIKNFKTVAHSNSFLARIATSVRNKCSPRRTQCG